MTTEPHRVTALEMCAAPCLLALTAGVHLTGMHLEASQYSGWIWLGLGLILASVLILELCCRRALASGPREPVVTLLLMVISLPLLSLLVFGALLDGGVRFKTCGYLYLGYLVLVAFFLVVRWKEWAVWELTLIRWLWVPLFVSGGPYLRPVFQGWGLVHFL